jgi:hypothetical protein
MRNKTLAILIVAALILSFFGVISMGLGYAQAINEDQQMQMGPNIFSAGTYLPVPTEKNPSIVKGNGDQVSEETVTSSSLVSSQPSDLQFWSGHPQPPGPQSITFGPNNISQTAINHLQPHTTVYLETGTYNLQFYVDIPLTIVGLGSSTDPSDQVLVQPTTLTSMATDPDPDTGYSEYPIILVNSTSGVTIDNIAVDGSDAGSGSYGDGFVGILFLDASGVISNDVVENIHLPPVDYGLQSGNAILVQTSQGQQSNVRIVDNLVTNYQKNGITANDIGTTVAIEGNTIYPLQAAQYITASNGIQIAFGASGAISGNTVTGNTYLSSSPLPYYATGILAYLDSGVTITDNTVSNNAVGITNYEAPTVETGPPSPPGPPGQPPSNGPLIRGNTLVDNTYEGIEVDQPGAAVSGNVVSGSFIGIAAISYSGDTLNVNAQMTHNSITGGTTSSSAESFYGALWSPSTLTSSVGILIIGDNTDTNPNVLAVGNTISGEGMGILMTTSPSSSMAGALKANGNSFSDNGIQYVDNTGTTNVMQILRSNTFDQAVIVSTGQASFLTTIWSQIADAVSNASSGNTILIAPGNYFLDSPIIITQPLTVEPLSMMGPSPPPSPPGPGPGPQQGPNGVYIYVPEDQSVGNGQPRSAFQIGGTNDPESNAGSGVSGPVLIQGLNFEGAGIEVPGTGASYLTIEENTFTNLFKEAIGYHGNAELTSGLGTYIEIIGNYIDGAGMSPNYDAIFAGNVFNSVISDNYIIYAGHGGIILTGTSQGDEGYNTISYNFVKNIPNEGIQLAFGTNDIVDYNVVVNAGEAASVQGRDAAIALFNPDQNDINVSYNLLENSYEGIGFDQAGTSYSSNPMGSGIVVILNDLINNAVDVYNGASSSLNAVKNYWGSPSGPTPTEISGGVDYIPWLTHPVPVPPPPPPPPSANNNISTRCAYPTFLNNVWLNDIKGVAVWSPSP